MRRDHGEPAGAVTSCEPVAPGTAGPALTWGGSAGGAVHMPPA